jgi:short-subunit dehydrogenase
MDCSWDFSGKTCIVTGAASGIGAQISLLLAKSGANVGLVDRDKDRLDSIRRECTNVATVKPLSILADVSVEQEVKSMVEQTLVEYGEINFLVTGAGVLYRSKFRCDTKPYQSATNL